MRIVSIGGGPAGLFFSILAKKSDPSHEITVFERDSSEATFGFGVVLSDRTLENLKKADRVTHESITRNSAWWPDIEVRHKGHILRCGGNGFSAIVRKSLLMVLRDRARKLGVDLRFEQEISDPMEVGGYDLILGVDGVNSGVRKAYADHFRPQIETGTAKYIWFGTAQPFDALTFIFAENEHGSFAVHAYPSEGETSTFIVETDEDSWRRAGLDRTSTPALVPGESDEESRVYCEELFAEHLGGHGLVTNNSKWSNFTTVINEGWHHGNTVILGDAAHTAHFSVGSGTKMAMEDAITLAAVVEELGATPEALAEYERRRRPAVGHIQAAARPSQAWWENFRRHMRLEPEQFAYHFLTRNPRLTHEVLKTRDHRFVQSTEAWFERQAFPEAEEGAPPAAPLATPLVLRSVTLPNRVSVVGVAPGEEQTGEVSHDERCARIVGAALWGAGLVLAVSGGPWDEARVEAWRRISNLVHDRSPGKLGLLVDGAAKPEDAVKAARRAHEAGFDVLELSDPDGVLGREFLPAGRAEGPGSARRVLAMLSRLRESWPEEKPVVVHLSVPETVQGEREVGEEVVRFASEFRAHGCDLIAVSLAPGLKEITDMRRVAQLAVSDRIRNEAHVPTMLLGGVPGSDEATTAVLSGRADLCRGRPSLASPLWTREEAEERLLTGTVSPTAVGEAGGEVTS